MPSVCGARRPSGIRRSAQLGTCAPGFSKVRVERPCESIRTVERSSLDVDLTVILASAQTHRSPNAGAFACPVVPSALEF
jgi:hypothetical protein